MAPHRLTDSSPVHWRCVLVTRFLSLDFWIPGFYLSGFLASGSNTGLVFFWTGLQNIWLHNFGSVARPHWEINLLLEKLIQWSLLFSWKLQRMILSRNVFPVLSWRNPTSLCFNCHCSHCFTHSAFSKLLHRCKQIRRASFCRTLFAQYDFGLLYTTSKLVSTLSTKHLTAKNFFA